MNSMLAVVSLPKRYIALCVHALASCWGVLPLSVEVHCRRSIAIVGTLIIMAPGSRIGMGRLPSTGEASAAYAPTTAPAATPDAMRRTGASDQSTSLPRSAQKPTVLSPALDQTPAGSQPPDAWNSKWGKSNASEGGPVFQVVSRGSRLATGTPSNYTPPSHPSKTQATIPRTRGLVANRGTPSSSSNASISLRNRSAASGSSSNSTSTTMAFGTRADRPTGRLPTNSTSIGNSTPAVGSCKSVVRVLSFEEAANSPSNSPAVKKQGVSSCPSTVAVPTAAPASATPPAWGKGKAGTAAYSDGAYQLTATASSNGNRANGFDGIPCAPPCVPIVNGSPRLLPAHQVLPARATATELGFYFEPLPAVHDAVSAAAAARVLLQQLLNSASRLTAAVGLSADSLGLAGCPPGAATVVDSDAEQTEQPGPQGDSTGTCNIAQKHFAALIANTAVMLESGCSAETVRQAVLPALLLQLAGLACHCSASGCGSGQSSTTGAGDIAGLAQDAEDAAAAAVSVLKASVRAGVTAARASMLPDGHEDTAAEAHHSMPAAAAVGAGQVPVASSSANWGSSRRLGRKILGGCLLMFWSMALLAAGFIVAVVWTVLEGGSLWVSGGSGAVSSSSAAEWPVEWLYDDWAATWTWSHGAVLPGRRFVP